MQVHYTYIHTENTYTYGINIKARNKEKILIYGGINEKITKI